MTFEEELELLLKEENEKRIKIQKHLTNCKVTFANDTNHQEGFVHLCSDNEYKYQFSYFDKRGPVGDFRRQSLENIAEGILEYGFSPIQKEQLKFIK